MKIPRNRILQCIENLVAFKNLRQVGYHLGDGTGVKVTLPFRASKNNLCAVLSLGKLDYKSRHRPKGLWKIERKKKK